MWGPWGKAVGLLQKRVFTVIFCLRVHHFLVLLDSEKKKCKNNSPYSTVMFSYNPDNLLSHKKAFQAWIVLYVGYSHCWLLLTTSTHYLVKQTAMVRKKALYLLKSSLQFSTLGMNTIQITFPLNITTVHVSPNTNRTDKKKKQIIWKATYKINYMLCCSKFISFHCKSW